MSFCCVVMTSYSILISVILLLLSSNWTLVTSNSTCLCIRESRSVAWEQQEMKAGMFRDHVTYLLYTLKSCKCFRFSFILTLTPATDVPLLALSDTTTKIQRRKISDEQLNANIIHNSAEYCICLKEKLKCICLNDFRTSRGSVKGGTIQVKSPPVRC